MAVSGTGASAPATGVIGKSTKGYTVKIIGRKKKTRKPSHGK
jgi:hypothetical protein